MSIEFFFALSFASLLTTLQHLLSSLYTPSYPLSSAVFLPVRAFGQVHRPRYDRLCPELSTFHHSSCFHTAILFSGALERSHAASLIKVPHALLELKLLCSIINHKKAECVLWLLRNKLRPNEEKKQLTEVFGLSFIT